MPTTPVFPPQFQLGVQMAWGFISAWSYIIPLSTIISVLVLSLIFQGTFWGWQGAKWLIEVIRGA